MVAAIAARAGRRGVNFKDDGEDELFSENEVSK